jgi:TM2 domain-containing membrane protein YozV
MPMNSKFLAAWLFFATASTLAAAPQFWNNPNATPTPPPPPELQPIEEPAQYRAATPTPVTAPAVGIPTPTPTPRPGLHAKNPTEAALFSVFVPGSGEVYAGDPVKGIVFAALFGLGLWQTIDNFQLVNSSGSLVAKNETAGNLFGLATLAAYGFGIQDAYNTADRYNKRNYLTLRFDLAPIPNARLAYVF